jgi:glycosyltransferase involved in cell wall biosynthesis
MKIAIVSTLRPYNEARLYDRQAVLWAERGHDVHIVARDFGEPLEALPPRLRVSRLKSPLSGWPRRLHLGWQAMQCVSALRPDVVHYHDPELHFWLPRLSRRGIKLVYDIRENHPFLVKHFNRFRIPQVSALFAALFWKLETIVLRQAFLVSVTSGVTEIYKPLNRPIATVMNFASRRRFVARGPGAEPIMICGGTLNEDRGLPDMIELLARVKKRVPAARLLLCGSFASPRLKAAVSDLARQSGVDSSIDMLEHVPHREYINSILPRARVGMSISRPNAQNDCAFPVRLGEYWAMGLPSVVNDLPELKRIHAKDPFFDIYRYGDTDSLQSIVERYLLDDEAARRAGRLARQRFEDVYNGEAEFAKLEQFYREELEPSGRQT